MEVFRSNQTEWEIADPEHFTGNARLRREQIGIGTLDHSYFL